MLTLKYGNMYPTTTAPDIVSNGSCDFGGSHSLPWPKLLRSLLPLKVQGKGMCVNQTSHCSDQNTWSKHAESGKSCFSVSEVSFRGDRWGIVEQDCSTRGRHKTEQPRSQQQAGGREKKGPGPRRCPNTPRLQLLQFLEVLKIATPHT